MRCLRCTPVRRRSLRNRPSCAMLAVDSQVACIAADEGSGLASRCLRRRLRKQSRHRALRSGVLTSVASSIQAKELFAARICES